MVCPRSWGSIVTVGGLNPGSGEPSRRNDRRRPLPTKTREEVASTLMAGDESGAKGSSAPVAGSMAATLWRGDPFTAENVPAR